MCEEKEAGCSAFAEAGLKLSPSSSVTRYPARADIAEEEAIFAIDEV